MAAQTVSLAPSSKLLSKMKASRVVYRRLRRSFRAMPAMPMPAALVSVYETASPADATCAERRRDAILAFFAHPTVSYALLLVALAVALAVVLVGLVIAWAVLGLFLGVPNGWDDFRPACVDLAAAYNQTLHPTYIPIPPDAEWGWAKDAQVHDCTLNQMWFNRCIKAFT